MFVENSNGQTVTTDKVDYSPQNIVVASGKGWTPGESVNLSLTEQVLDPTCPVVENRIVQADAEGSFKTDLHSVKETDLGGFFHLKATGSNSSHVSTITFNDAGGSYSIDFSAYDPEKYARKVYSDFATFPSGRTSSPLGLPTDTKGHTLHSNTVESLEPSFLGLGQIVAFEFWVRVDEKVNCADGIIRFTAQWDTKTTSGDDFGFNPTLGVIAAFVDISHDATEIVDSSSNASAKVVNWGMNGTYITGTFEVSGLDSRDEIPVEVWLVLKESVDKKATGNVQSALNYAVTAGGGTPELPCSSGDVIQTGQQTVPLIQVGSFFTTDVDVSVTKTDSQDPVNICGSFYYTITVTNSGPSVANNVVVTDVLDPNVTYVSSSVVDNIGTTIWTPVVSGQTLTFSTAYMNIGESVTIKVDVNVANTAPHTGTGGTGSATSCPTASDLCNHVSVTTISDDTNATNNNYYQPTGVSCETVVPVISNCPVAEIDLGCNPTLPTCETVAALKITATDACFGSITPICSAGSVVQNDCIRTQKFTLTFTDGCGNSSKCEVNYKWTADTAKLVVTGKTSIMLGCNANPSGSFEAPKATDDCGTPVLKSGYPLTGDTITVGCTKSLTRTWIYVDACMNESLPFEQTVSWNSDDIKPVIKTTAKDDYLGCNPSNLTPPEFTGTDNCEGNIVPDVTTEGPMKEGCKVTQKWTASYTDKCGNFADNVSVTYTWTVDTIKPVITSESISHDLGCLKGEVTAPVFAGTDNCEGNITPKVSTLGPDNDGCKYTQTWKANYTDDCGNVADEVSITYTWTSDNEKPVIKTESTSHDLGCLTGDIKAPVFTGTDNCENNITPEVSTLGPDNDGCKYTQTWTAGYTDKCGNPADNVSVTYTWTVDTIKPVITSESISHDLGCLKGEVTAPVFAGTDNCEGTIKPEVTSEGPDHTGCLYTQTWTANYTDNCGNMAISQSVTYTWKVDETGPEISCPSNASICEGETLDGLTLPTAKDGCGTAEVTWTRSDGATELNAPFTQQITTITFYATDECKNKSSCSMTVTIVPCSKISLKKTTGGIVDPTLTWTFVLYEGNYGGKVLSTQTTKNVSDGILFSNYGPLSVSKSYTVCETGIPSGFGTTWFRDDNSCDGKNLSLIPYTPPEGGGVFNPNLNDNPPQDIGTRCYTFSGNDFPDNKYGDPTCYYMLEVDNKFPGGEPRTPGYWKNWTSKDCSGGNQYITATANSKDKNGDGKITAYDRVYSGWALLDDILDVKGITWTGGTAYPTYSYAIATCKIGVMILNQMDTKNKKHSNDAAYTLAMHLLAYQLNQGAGAHACSNMTGIEKEAILILAKYKFNSTGDYLLGNNTKTKADYNRALKLASILDSYNNGASCETLGDQIGMIGMPAAKSIQSSNNNAEALTEGISFRAYPNPFKDIISFEIGMTYDSHVRIEIFANNGTPLGIILDEDLIKGDLRKIEFDGSRYLHTIFMYRITTKLQQLSGTVMKTR